MNFEKTESVSKPKESYLLKSKQQKKPAFRMRVKKSLFDFKKHQLSFHDTFRLKIRAVFVKRNICCYSIIFFMVCIINDYS